jgi:hypothetical protein
VKIVINLGVPLNESNFTSWTINSFSKGIQLHSIKINYKCHMMCMCIICTVKATTKGESASSRDIAVVTVCTILEQQKTNKPLARPWPQQYEKQQVVFE